MTLVSLKKKKDRFILEILGFRLTFYRYLRILREIYLTVHFRDLNDRLNTKFNVNMPKEAYYHLSGDVELVKVALKDIKVPCGHRKTCSLDQTKCYRSLFEDPGKMKYAYNEGGVYVNAAIDNPAKRIKNLEESLGENGYDPSKCVVVLRKNNVLIDGAHRCALLYKKYGGDYQILVVREK